MTAKKLFLDIETAPMTAYVWSMWKENTTPDKLQDDWFIMSFAASWDCQDEVFYADVRDTYQDEDDSDLMAVLWLLLDEADIVIAHNGRKFDARKINARLIMNGFPPPRPYKVVDTLEMARKHFAFSSNKLEYLAKLFGNKGKGEHKEFPGFKLWKECLKGNPKAWEEMKLYNIDDVKELKPVYYKLLGWAEGMPNVAAYDDSEVVRCPKCGCDDITYEGYTYTQTGKYRQIRCKKCGGWSRTRYTENSVKKRHSLLSN